MGLPVLRCITDAPGEYARRAGNIRHPDADKTTAARLAVDGQVALGQVALALQQLQANRDRPFRSMRLPEW